MKHLLKITLALLIGIAAYMLFTWVAEGNGTVVIVGGRRLVVASEGGPSWTDAYSDYLLVHANMEGTNAAGESIDASGNGFDGVPKPNSGGGPTMLLVGSTNINGRLEHYTSWDGSDDSLHFPTNACPLVGGTIAFWINIQSWGAYGEGPLRYRKSDGSEFIGVWEDPPSDANLDFRYYDGGGYQVSLDHDPIATNAWVHFVWTWTNNASYLYTNAILADSDTSCAFAQIVGTSFELGSSYYGGNKYAEVLMDDFRTYSTPLPPTAVTNLFFNTPPVRDYPNANPGGNIEAR